MMVKKYAFLFLCSIFVVFLVAYDSEATWSDQKTPVRGELDAHSAQMTGVNCGKSGPSRVNYAIAMARSAENGNTKTNVQDQKIKIGIIEFQSVNEEAKKDILGQVFSQVLTTSFVHSEAFTIIERAQIEKVVKELQLSQSGIIDLASAKQIGKMLGADAILTGSVIKFGNDVRVDARIIDVESGIILTAEKTMGKADLKSIGAMADAMVKNLVNKLYGDKK